MCDVERILTPREIKRLADAGVEYPWTPFQSLRLLDASKDRRRMPTDRESITKRLQLVWPDHPCPHCGAEQHADKRLRVYATVGLYEDGTPGELFFSGDRMGKFPHGVLHNLAMMASLALQYGAPIEKVIAQWRSTRFPPEGFTGDKEFPRCTSLLDYVARWLEARFVTRGK
jgi:ribonucleoside-diphosphate reductase alpha chain